ncbi:hypothetical protein [Acuticoccus sediminis]|uniref:hypothetical protein n=1 Tax=Acuticoccus sediminis TaxID=2184697 RepID=UPI001CFC59DA|nr:hypothetical protein [Acuticoccus sediminis]
MQKMKALRSLRYGTRRLQAGDYFDAKMKDVRILEAIKKARVAREVGTLAPPPADLVQMVKADAEPVTDIKAIRDEYERVLGKRPFNGWDIATLRAKIAEHGAS